MLVLELPEDKASELARHLEDAGISSQSVREERYFGDAHMVSLILENSQAAITVISGIVSIWTGISSIRASQGKKKAEIANLSREDVIRIFNELKEQ